MPALRKEGQVSDTDIALSLKQQLNLCVSTLIGMGHTVCTEDGIVVEINENKRAASLVAHVSDGVTTLVNKGPHDVCVTDPTGTSTHRAKPGDPVAIYKAP
jgi:hypothetical protein